MYELKEVASGEADGIFYDEKLFYRVVDAEHAAFFLTMLGTLKHNIKEKLVKTTLFDGQCSFPKQTHQAVLTHEKISYITYPHEWCALMLKEAALFHLKLQMDLLDNHLYLKDAHPWNILYENGKFVFVDIPSIVDNSDWHHFYQIMHGMFKPYFFLPLCGYAYGKREWIKKRMESTTLNAATDTINYRNCFPYKQLSFKNMLNLFKLITRLFKFDKILRKKTDISHTLKELYALIDNIPVEKENSDYKSYYIQKNELSDFMLNDAWNEKQRSIYQILLNTKISSVLDIACNTGWYSILAAKQGKKVVALDIDEACIEELYSQVKKHGLDIVPLHCALNLLTKDKYSIQSGKRVLINFEERIKCDVVLALGILHHLVLGEGSSFDEVFTLLSNLSNSQVVIEFVDRNDDKVKEEPSFFKAFSKDSKKFEFYTLENFLEISKKYFGRCQILPSNPDTRKIIIFDAKIVST